MMPRLSVPLLIAILISVSTPSASTTKAGADTSSQHHDPFPVPLIDFAPKAYLCYKTTSSIVIDGRLDESDWHSSAWTDSFMDIEGDRKPLPYFDTKAKMLWDSTYFYVGAYLQETNVWATLTERDAVIYHDNDFEVFIDPDGDTHEYYELEINAFGTEWDLFLVKPYRDGGPALNAWDIQGLRTAIHIDGTLNDPSDTDRGWGVEIAIPWRVLREAAHKPSPPRDGDQWRVNFSRVQWRTDTVDGKTQKIVDRRTGKALPEENWVWSPQGLIAMHYPEMWGFVQFADLPAGTPGVASKENPEEQIKWMLRRLYYAQRDFHARFGTYTDNVGRLRLEVGSRSGFSWPPEIAATRSTFAAHLLDENSATRWWITHDGRVWSEPIR